MKQRRIKELTINHYEQGSSVQYTPSREEEYAAVLAQAEAHQDLRFHYNDNILILPWETVTQVNATYETADVAAPTDTICGGEPTNPLVLKLIEPSESCYVLDNDAIYSFVSTYDCGGEEDCHATQFTEGELNRAFVTQILFNGEDITEDESVEGTYELTLVNGVATLKITVSYEGYTATQSLTATDVCD